MSNKENLLRGLIIAAPLLGLPLACGSSGQAPPTVEKDLSAFTEKLDAGDGVTVEFVYDAEHHMGSAIATGPESQTKKLQDLASIKGGVAALYNAVHPGKELPARIKELDKAILSSSLKATAVEAAVADEDAQDTLAPLVDEAKAADKAMVVSPWKASWCKDHTDSFQARQDWYQSFDWCYENVTNPAYITRTTVREGFAILQMVSGTGTLMARYKASTSGSWITYGSWAISQGTYRWVRNWSTSNTPIDVRYDVLDTTGKTYNIEVQTAETPVSSMPGNALPKNTSSNDYYRVACACNDGIVATAQQCIGNPTGVDAQGNAFPTWNGAQWTCGVVCSSDGGGGAIGMERRTTGAACNNSIAPLICTVNGSFVNSCK
jgi:hypothetical protein